MQIKVAIADCNELYRAGVKAVLNQQEQITVTGEVSNCDDLKRLFDSPERPEVLVLNLSFTNESALELITRLTTDYPKIPLVAIGTLSEETFAARVLRAGGAAYLKADCSAADLVDAIEVVKSGRMYLTSKASTAVIEQLQNRNSHKSAHSSLSDREYQIFNMICRGTSLVKIGLGFGISVKTVSTYRSRILKKMNLNNNAELVQYAVRHQIVEPIPA